MCPKGGTDIFRAVPVDMRMLPRRPNAEVAIASIRRHLSEGWFSCAFIGSSPPVEYTGIRVAVELWTDMEVSSVASRVRLEARAVCLDSSPN